MKRLARATFFILALFAAPLGLAHDFWIEPSNFRPAAGTPLRVSLRVGEHFRGDPVGRNAERIVKFTCADAEGEKAIPGVEGADPAGLLRVEKAGFFVLGYRSNRAFVELEPKKFEDYLQQEGLEKIIALRAERGESDKKGREVYSRCVKSLLLASEKKDKAGGGQSVPAATVSVDKPAAAGGDRTLSFTLELVAGKNPYALRADDELPVQLLYEGKPLEGALLVAMNHDEPDKKLSARSDKDGRVVFKLPRAGVWLVKAVHMVPAPQGVDADWESFWASLTFEIP